MPTGKQFTRGSFGKAICFQGMTSYELLPEVSSMNEAYSSKHLPV